MDEFISVMKALSDPGRVRIIKLLQGHRLCAREIQRVLGLAQPTVSSHLKILEHAGFIEKERQGSRMIFSLSDGSQSVYVETMLVELYQWLDDDELLTDMRRSLAEVTTLLRCSENN